MALTKVSFSMIQGAPANVLDYGAVLDGVTDDAPAFQNAFDASNVVYVPPGASAYLGTAFTMPTGGVLLAEGASLIFGIQNAIAFEANVSSTITATVSANATLVPVADGSKFNIGDRVYIKRVDTIVSTSTASQDPSDLQYTGEIYSIAGVSGNNLTLSGPLRFSIVDTTSTVSVIPQTQTKIIGATLVNDISTATYLLRNSTNNLLFERVVFDCKQNGGVRYTAAADVIFDKCQFVNSNLGTTVVQALLFLGYGATEVTVQDCIFQAITEFDAQLVLYGGVNKLLSKRNSFTPGKTLTYSAGIHFGLKSYDCSSQDDYFTGGNYGIYGAYGAQRILVQNASAVGQNDACIYFEECQYLTVTSPCLQLYLASETQTKACISMKDCDYITIDGSNGTLQASSGWAITLYPSAGYASTQRKDVTIKNVKSNNGININVGLDTFLIDGNRVSHITSYSTVAGITRGIVSNNECGPLTLTLPYNCKVFNNRIDANAYTYGIKMGSASQVNELYSNYIYDCTTAFDIPSDSQSVYSTAIYSNNYIDTATVTNYVNNTVAESPKPSTGVMTTPIPPNFFLPVTAVDFATAKTVAGFRSKGNGATDGTLWFSVAVSES